MGRPVMARPRGGGRCGRQPTTSTKAPRARRWRAARAMSVARRGG
jgi:hypothetical protein